MIVGGDLEHHPLGDEQLDEFHILGRELARGNGRLVKPVDHVVHHVEDLVLGRHLRRQFPQQVRRVVGRQGRRPGVARVERMRDHVEVLHVAQPQVGPDDVFDVLLLVARRVAERAFRVAAQVAEHPLQPLGVPLVDADAAGRVQGRGFGPLEHNHLVLVRPLVLDLGQVVIEFGFRIVDLAAGDEMVGDGDRIQLERPGFQNVQGDRAGAVRIERVGVQVMIHPDRLWRCRPGSSNGLSGRTGGHCHRSSEKLSSRGGCHLFILS